MLKFSICAIVALVIFIGLKKLWRKFIIISIAWIIISEERMEVVKENNPELYEVLSEIKAEYEELRGSK